MKAGKKCRRTAIMASWGVLASAVYKICSNALYLWKEVSTWTFNFFQKAEFSIDTTPALLGVGYIIGPRISGLMFSGGAIA